MLIHTHQAINHLMNILQYLFKVMEIVFQWLSKHIDKNEKNYQYKRNMVYECTKNNKEILKYFLSIR